jgi:uncharacterized protein DUF1761
MWNNELNWLAIVVGGFIPMVIGMVWYTVLFGKQWQAIVGLSDEAAKAGSGKAMGFSILMSMILSFVMAQFVGAFALTQLGDAVQLAFWFWLGFSLTTNGMNNAYEQKPLKLLFINQLYALISFIGVAILHSQWR